MKVLAPINSYDELDMLAASGAEEFYLWNRTARMAGSVHGSSVAEPTKSKRR